MEFERETIAAPKNSAGVRADDEPHAGLIAVGEEKGRRREQCLKASKYDAMGSLLSGARDKIVAPSRGGKQRVVLAGPTKTGQFAVTFSMTAAPPGVSGLDWTTQDS